MDAVVNARRRAVLECQGRPSPVAPVSDRLFEETQHFAVEEAWTDLNVEYLLGDWPPSMLS
jgi:hypothetical protein